MGKTLERRIGLLEKHPGLAVDPTRESAKREVLSQWNEGTYGAPTERAIRPFVDGFLREYAANRDYGYDRDASLRGARAGIECWMQLSPSELRIKCEALRRSAAEREGGRKR